ncbi:PepSY-associated TM helix domain-containing protein [Pusillimonas sp. CC-YST705]|uniref:PepSY-associated TM helix domain-containing protein n=1 Tax=Mesopusillimonas faecipullorum TaxID=2755040 RepID=A0ABS8C9S3_9BURK|nr:PepSY-associated TM helix domain-containing protein [Mesopusillimonas faecipullorum]MCB5362753.1 PepSY-associated TM helix domain-containing protein [Mesopusillimonas faecipullorum]
MNSSSAARRSLWLKTLHQWHWISAALSLAGMVLFAITGLTLNNASWVEASPAIENRQAHLPEPLLESLSQAPSGRSAQAQLPLEVRQWLENELDISIGGRDAEFSSDEIYLPLPQPGADAWLSIDLASGDIEYERSDRGWVAYFNDLHKGRHTGTAWSWFIDVFAIACLIFALTGLTLLAFHARQRQNTWPLASLGLIAPLILMILFIH